MGTEGDDSDDSALLAQGFEALQHSATDIKLRKTQKNEMSFNQGRKDKRLLL